ncbi:MAG TPA: BadF/BadG/BcrA/BcrD ATPase family protein [Acidobacteriaceae bacterium]|nr:BadF/BadG/BcrA/BcrD ATPase family protein [Acidobacteriaceae bacterium]
MAYFVALDGGGTKTECWVADENSVLGRASTGTIKLMNVDEATATSRLQNLLREAATDAAIALHDVTRTCFGLAGSSSETVRQWAEKTLRGVVSGEIIICGDEEIALDAAFRGGPGVLVIAGTGSNIVGRCADGTMQTAGGWGPMLGDEGSGHWIGVEAIKSALRAQDRGVETCMLKDIESHWGLRSQAELVAFANQRSRVEFAELTAVVARCAEDGDALAASVLERAGHELAEQVSLVASKMHHAGCAATDALHVAYSGSVLAKISRVRKAMEEALRASMPNVEVAQSAVEPLEGALWRARR